MKSLAILLFVCLFASIGQIMFYTNLTETQILLNNISIMFDAIVLIIVLIILFIEQNKRRN